MKNSRNFANDISNKSSFISLRNEINKKIKDTLFDENSLFLSSSFNFFCSNYNSIELTQEGKNISILIDNLSTLNDEEILENNSSTNGNPKMKIDSENKKKFNESEDEKSSSFGSKLTKFSQNEESKHKFNICLLKYADLLNLLDIDKNTKEINVNNNNEKNININKLNEFDKDKIKLKIIELENVIKNNENIVVKNNYLRKMVCLKLYKALNFALKNFNLEDDEIKHICMYIEIQGRILDSSMTNKYKEFIENILKRISLQNIEQIKKNI